MSLTKVQDIFSLSVGQVISKRNLYDLVQYSKIDGSEYWSGDDYIVGNTPQQGINWIGQSPSIRGVIIKTRSGSYDDDGWSDENKTAYQYSFKARNGEISYPEKANSVLIQQPQHLYPVFLFTECPVGWRFEGTFSVSDIADKYVVLHRGSTLQSELNSTLDEVQYNEGGRKYVTHLLAERNKGVVNALKELESWICDICDQDFMSIYGVKYIEAHHKVPISTYSSTHSVSTADLALLCPNCHKAVHIYMKQQGLDYPDIKALLLAKQG